MKDTLKLTGEVFAIGAAGYSLLEVAWRGFTHWTMTVTGGICFSAVYFLNDRYRGKPIFQRCLLSAGAITGVEFLVGCLVNRVLHWNVWDYSRRPLNLLGQVCPLYSLLWLLLSVPLCKFSERLPLFFQKEA